MKVFSFYNLDKPSSRKLRKLNWKLSKMNLTIESQKMQRTFVVHLHFLQRSLRIWPLKYISHKYANRNLHLQHDPISLY